MPRRPSRQLKPKRGVAKTHTTLKARRPARLLRSQDPPTSPSKETDTYWIIEEAREFPYPAPTDRSGKWLLFVRREDVDGVWSNIVAALHAGRLGNCAKVSTTVSNPFSAAPRKHVICVYTYDADDERDVMRVRDTLRELGFVRPIAYKTDRATAEGQYAVKGHVRISKYFS